MPLDVEPLTEIEPAENGKGGLRGLQVFEDKSRIRQATVEDVVAGKPLYRSHFATCPDAARYRR